MKAGRRKEGRKEEGKTERKEATFETMRLTACIRMAVFVTVIGQEYALRTYHPAVEGCEGTEKRALAVHHLYF